MKKTAGPTARQIEAFRLVYINGCTQTEAGKVLGISQQAVSRLLRRSEKWSKNRHVFTTHQKRKKWRSYSNNKHSLPKMKF